MDIARLREKIRADRRKQEAARFLSPEPAPVPPTAREEERDTGSITAEPDLLEPALVPESPAPAVPSVEPAAEDFGDEVPDEDTVVETPEWEPLPAGARGVGEQPPSVRADSPGVEETGEVLDETDDGEGREAVVELLGFRAGGEEFALRITDVDEILRMQRFARIPRTPAYLLGVTSLRGRMIPVLDLKQRLSLAFITPSSGRILVLGGQDSPFGLCVDSVIGVIRAREEEIRPPLETLEETQARFIEGVVIAKGGFVSLLDLESIADMRLGTGA